MLLPKSLISLGNQGFVFDCRYRAAADWLEWQDCGILNTFACTAADDLKGTDYEERVYHLGAGIH